MKNNMLSGLAKKSIICLFGILLFASGSSFAQKYAYVNTQYILENIPDYKSAQQQLDNLSITWQKEIEDKYAIIDFFLPGDREKSMIAYFIKPIRQSRFC